MSYAISGKKLNSPWVTTGEFYPSFLLIYRFNNIPDMSLRIFKNCQYFLFQNYEKRNILQFVKMSHIIWLFTFQTEMIYQLTLYNEILLAGNQEKHQNWVPSIYHIICDWFSWEWSKNNQNGQLKKTEFFKTKYLSWKILRNSPWVSRINCCQGRRCG